HRLHPPVGALLAAAVLARGQVQRLARRSHDLARVGIVGHQLHALGAHIQSYEQPHLLIPEKKVSATKNRVRHPRRHECPLAGTKLRTRWHGRELYTSPGQKPCCTAQHAASGSPSSVSV